MESPKRRFQKHRVNATRRGIKFLLTFEEWLKIWTDSGHLYESGKCKGQYCMARFGDKGPYKVGNVRIILVEDNHSEMRHSEETKEHFSYIHTGRLHTTKTKRQISRSALGNKRALGYKHTSEQIVNRLLARYGVETAQRYLAKMELR